MDGTLKDDALGTPKAAGLSFAPLVDRIGGKEARAWDVHYRAAELGRQGRDVILLSVGDPDFDTPRSITDAAFQAVEKGRTHYTPAAGIQPLRDCIARYESTLLGHPVGPERILVGSGAQYCLYSAMRCVAGPADEVIIFDPYYVTFAGVVAASGAQQVTVSLAQEGGGYRFNLERLAAALTPRTRAILINFPHNPTGLVLTQEDLDGLAELLAGRDIWLIADEVYHTLSYDRPFVSAGAHPGLKDCTIGLRSFSKSHAMSGWRLGWAVVPDKTTAMHMENLSNCVLYGSPPFIQDAAIVALETRIDEVEAMREAYRERRDLTVRRVAAIPGIACVSPQSGIFCLIDVRGTGLDEGEFARRLVEAEGVSLLPADAFGPAGEGHVRLSYTIATDRLDEAFDRIERFCRGL